MSTALARTHFDTSRAAEYASASELQAQTGQPVQRFADVLLKELVDNALDAAEVAATQPVIGIDVVLGTTITVRVRDAGPGISADVVRRILNFSTRTSDKTHYRAPCRGAQGNALKTVIGIPHALGSDKPVVIEARGVRHRIHAWIDPAGELRIDHDEEPCRRRRGTAVEVSIPAGGQEFDAGRWARSFSLFNPHAKVKIRIRQPAIERDQWGPGETRDSYHATVVPGETWRKHGPSDPTAPAWYDDSAGERLVFAHIADARRGGRDLTVREFVRQFRGLTGSAKAKRVTDQFPHINRLSDFEDRPADVARLFGAMRAQARAPQPTALGLIGEEHLHGRLDDWFGVKRHWYRKVTGDVDGIPFVFEVIVAETEESGYLFHALNFSPTFDDPLSGNTLSCREFSARSTQDFLRNAHASPIPLVYDYGNPRITAAIHLVCPALEFMDRGKTRVTLPREMAAWIADALWRATADLYREGKRRERDAAREERRQAEWARATQDEEWTLRDAVFEVMEEAVRHASDNDALEFSAKDLHYAIRPFVQKYTGRDLTHRYFSQTLLPEYQKIHGPIPGLYYDPRGVLYEPHSGREVPLGTREVEDYEFPAWQYNKILYIEKKGTWGAIKTARLAERYDMAVVAAEGYANVAARTLFAAADRDQQYKLFVFHDADPAGYEIARTLREETRRMPGYSVDVIDIGLGLEEALELGLQTEEFTRKKALPQTLQLNEVEREYFTGRQVGRKTWVARRVELNALIPAARIEFIERKLREAGATEKVVPKDRALGELTRGIYAAEVRGAVDDMIAHLLDPAAITANLIEELNIDLDNARQWIQEAHARDRATWWRNAVAIRLRKLLRGEQVAIKAAVRAAVNGGRS